MGTERTLGENEVIVADGLTKYYSRNVPLWKWVARGLGLKIGLSGSGHGEVKALDDVSLRVKAGEAFGIIGRNGAGKSTLLQVLVGTLRPTSGSFTLKGRVTALLELGSGFNPEFTGRENVYLSGSIYGIGREEMDRRFPQIAAFAEIGDFIDAPVRTYSTGMLMRVAFAVAASMEPDVLIVDEALSVGDILFQQKCNRRLRELLEKGVTLLVVTHDTSFVLNLCQRALWLHLGRTAYLGEAGACVREYVAAMAAAAGSEVRPSEASDQLAPGAAPSSPALDLASCRRLGDGGIWIERAWVLNEAGESSTVFRHGDWCQVSLQLRARQEVQLASGGCELRDRHGQVMFATGLRVARRLIERIPAGEARLVTMRFKLDLAPGQYSLDVGCGAGERENDTWERIAAAAILEVSVLPEGDVVHGLVRLPYEVFAFRL